VNAGGTAGRRRAQPRQPRLPRAQPAGELGDVGVADLIGPVETGLIHQPLLGDIRGRLAHQALRYQNGKFLVSLVDPSAEPDQRMVGRIIRARRGRRRGLPPVMEGQRRPVIDEIELSVPEQQGGSLHSGPPQSTENPL
jgi:hypothetical protein